MAEHFNKPGHEISDLKFCILLGGFKDNDSWKIAELNLILKLNTKSNGLNKDISFLSNYKYFNN